MHTLNLEKRSLRRIDPAVLDSQLSRILARALGGGRGRVWEAGKPRPPAPAALDSGGWLYKVALRFRRTGRRTTAAAVDRQWERIQTMARDAGRGRGWIDEGAEPMPERNGAAAESAMRPRPFAAVTVNTDRGEHFAHLFERDHQIALVHSALSAYVASGFEDRFHCVLYGPPACGKTEILRSFARMVGPEAVLLFDATSTTKAGAERVLLETAEIPPVLIVEEIEKTDEQSLRWLLGVLDQRAELRKVTHRLTASRTVKLLCLATVNDIELFRRVMDGALASRFTHKVHCPRPSREVLRRILLREIEQRRADAAWIDPALDWCEEEGTNDPRRAIAVCLCGREGLLTGEYQQALRATMAPK
jgi:hypothetical protein